MVGEEAAILERSFQRVRRACEIIKVVCAISVVIFVGMGLLLFLPPFFNGENIAMPDAINAFVYVAGSAVISLLAMLIFSDIAKGVTPFSKKQVWRLRGIACCFALFAISDFVFSSAFFNSDTMNAVNVTFFHDVETTDQVTLDINIMTIMMALLSVFFSVAFEYATLLQANIDETL